VLHFVWTFPERTLPFTTLVVGESDAGSLPVELRTRPLQPSSVLDQAGIYIEVTDGAGRQAYLAPITDLRVVRSEGHAGGAALRRVRRGAVAARFPFIPGGSLSLFEVDEQGHVVTAYFSAPLGRSPGTRRFRVPR
jgi:hypothetical protein